MGWSSDELVEEFFLEFMEDATACFLRASQRSEIAMYLSSWDGYMDGWMYGFMERLRI